jgi:hypothetical protein
MLNIDMHRVVEPGVFELMVGPSSDQTSTVKFTVIGQHGETGRPIPPAPPAGSESGVVSTFDDLKVAANFGSWMAAGDATMGNGKSTSSIAVVQPGADRTKGALEIGGEVVAGPGFNFAGAIYSPGGAPFQPVNLGSKKDISFWAKGDGKTYTMVVLSESASNNNGIPPMTQFVAGPDWKLYTFPLSQFETDGSDLEGLGFLLVQQPGKFQFEIDQVEIK